MCILYCRVHIYIHTSLLNLYPCLHTIKIMWLIWFHQYIIAHACPMINNDWTVMEKYLRGMKKLIPKRIKTQSLFTMCTRYRSCIRPCLMGRGWQCAVFVCCLSPRLNNNHTLETGQLPDIFIVLTDYHHDLKLPVLNVFNTIIETNWKVGEISRLLT